MNYKRYPVNTEGRDFVVGDIHGSYRLVLEALKASNFNIKKDRLFCCGDLVDRGPESQWVLDFLNTGYVHSVRGNHEQMFIDLYADGEPHPAVVQYMCSHNGMGWWLELQESERQRMLDAFRKLPLAIEIETTRGTVGIVHADVPSGMNWKDFVASLDQPDIAEHCVWSRDRINSNDLSGVEGIGRLYVGHTPQNNGLKKYGNVYAIDTGAVFGYVGGNVESRLTMVHVACSTRAMIEPREPKLIDLLNPEELPQNPFGVYGVASL